jgi:predicted nucleotidyltransferase
MGAMGEPARASLFSTVPTRDYLQFWQAGRFQPQRVARFLGLSKVQLAQLAAVAPASVRFDDKTPRMLSERLLDIAATCELVAQAFDGNVTKTALWFKTPNPQLGNLSPCELLRRGEREVLQRHVIQATQHEGMAAQPLPQPDAALLLPIIPPGQALLDARRDEIAHLCQRYAVRSLAVFGSALMEDFNPDHSDIDLAVQFAPSAECSPARQYFDFKADLEHLLKCRVDLVELTAMPDSRLRRLIISTQTLLYDAAV